MVTCAALDEVVRATGTELDALARAARGEPRLAIKVVAQESAPGHHQPRAVASDTGRGYKLIGGGAVGDHRGGPGTLLVGSYPDGNSWVAASVDHLRPSPQSTVTAYAVYLVDPEEAWDVTIVEKSSPPGPHPSVQVDLPEGYALTGGGFRVQCHGWARLTTQFMPVKNDRGRYTSWVVRAYPHMQGPHDHGIAQAWAIGIKPRNGVAPRESTIVTVGGTPGQLHQPATAGPGEMPRDGMVVLGGGAKAEAAQHSHSGFLSKNGFDTDRRRWIAEAKGISDPRSRDQGLPTKCDVTMYVITRPGTMIE